MTNEELIKHAIKAREKSYSPYSKFRVGAAILAKGGKVYLGTNIENCSYPAGICAERCAFSNAIINGAKDFEKIAVVGDSKDICYPCGICRQVISELAPNIEVICATVDGAYKSQPINELLPNAFTPDNLKD